MIDMNEPMEVSIRQARALMIDATGLTRKQKSPANKADLMQVIQQLYALQLDTISVVARAHHHILWSRLGTYDIRLLDQLHREKKLFEYYVHGVCLMPIEDYRLYRSLMLHDFFSWKSLQKWADQNDGFILQMLKYVSENGPVRSSDFKADRKRGVWWDWKKEKAALEYLYYRGDLMITHRSGFQRIYDIRERVLPDWDDASAPPYDEAIAELTFRAVKLLGIASAKWASQVFYIPRKETEAFFHKLINEKRLLPVHLPLNTKDTFAVPAERFPELNRINPDNDDLTGVKLLSPFDPIMTDRERVRKLFDFDYTIECYTPAAKRKYGYFALPVLSSNQLIGRVDAAANRRLKTLTIKSFHLEPGVAMTQNLADALEKELRRYASWQGLETLAGLEFIRGI